MTEKRFQYNVNKNTIEENGKFVAYLNSVDGFRIANKLTTLAKENEQLKKQLECSREEADDYCEELMGKDEFVRLYKRQKDDALKENEQLKQELQSIYDVATLKKARDIVDKVYDDLLYETSDESDYARKKVLKCLEDIDNLRDDLE